MSGAGITVEQRLTLLMESGANCFDPVRFSYIESLARRSVGKSVAVCRLIEVKIIKALADYQNLFDRACADAENIVIRVSSEYPDSADKISELYKGCDFNGVQRLAGKLDRDNGRRIFSALMEMLVQNGITTSENDAQLSFNDLMRMQEDEAVKSFANFPTSEGQEKSEDRWELRVLRHFKELRAKRYSDKLVTSAIKERPEDPGPLNTQMLATHTLSVMRNLSPAYLNRFVSYIDTLLWLKHAG